jgi:hypothetical protein
MRIYYKYLFHKIKQILFKNYQTIKIFNNYYNL